MSQTLMVVLAAGEGSRMKSARPKILHEVAGRPIIAHVAAAAAEAGDRLALVVSPDRDDVVDAVRKVAPKLQYFVQSEQRGTAHAAQMARPAWEDAEGNVVVVYGDHPLLRAENFKGVLSRLADGFDAAIMGFQSETPAGFGRLIVDGELLLNIREERDASPQERAITLCNGCALAFRADVFRALIDKITDANAQKEFYVTDLVPLANQAGYRVTYALEPEEDVMGVNSRSQLALAERLFQKRMRKAAMDGGVTLIDPDSVFFAYDTVLGRDVTIEPNVYFGPGVFVADDVAIRAFSHIEGARLDKGTKIGPFARLRPGAHLGESVHLGNFVEIKNAEIGPGAKINHLSYVGDADIGAATNVGAGAITCNYDGVNKHRTKVGQGVFVGTNTSLVAPVSVGDGAYIASGSVINTDVPADALAIARNRQENKPGYASRLKTRAETIKRAKTKLQDKS